MKVLHVGFSDTGGGAAIAMIRIHEAIQSLGVRSEILVIEKTIDRSDIKTPSNNSLFKILSFFRPRLSKFFIDRLQSTIYETARTINIFRTGLGQAINNSDADIVHLHWIGRETIGIKELSEIKKPIVWTFHDLWAVLGAEHTNISFSNRYETGYTSSKRPEGYKGFDIEKWAWKKKLKYWRSIDIYPVAVSRWVESTVKKSPIFFNKSIATIHNPLNTKSWKPVDKQLAQELIHIKTNKKIILFGAMNALLDPIKGYKYLKSAIGHLDNKDDYVILIFGASGGDFFQNELEVKFLGRVYDEVTLRIIYSAADVVVIPSLQETFCQVATEAMACGTPVVAFGTTGPLDIIDHKISGYLAEPYNPLDFAEGIKWVLNNANLLKNKVINKVNESFNYYVIGSQYKSLYEKVLKDASRY